MSRSEKTTVQLRAEELDTIAAVLPIERLVDHRADLSAMPASLRTSRQPKPKKLSCAPPDVRRSSKSTVRAHREPGRRWQR